MERLLHSARIYLFLTFFCWKLGIFYLHCFAQIPLELGDYRSIASGDFDNPAIWEIWNGSLWINAVHKPNLNNNIFIDQYHEVRLTNNESAKHLYLFSAADPGRKLNLQNYELHVYGALRALRKEGGVFFINSVSSLLIDWIYPQTGKIVFKGSSRTVVDRASWSANNQNSRYTVVFAPDPGETLIVNSAFKASTFIIRTGTVLQTVNSMGLPACSTFSFNTQAIFNGGGPYGDFIIESGGTLISDCSAPLDQIIRRSNTAPSALFHLKSGANLILNGSLPRLEAANIVMEGTVIYNSNTGNQQMLGKTFAGSSEVLTYHDLIFRGNSTKVLKENISLTGNLTNETSGTVLTASTHFHFFGPSEQGVSGWQNGFTFWTVNKSSGRILLEENLMVHGNLNMINGQIDFNGFELSLNGSGPLVLNYQGGSWLNLSQFNYLNLPDDLNALNATFPFEDAFQGGIRKIQLLGPSPGGKLSIRFVEIPGANWEPNFNDNDGTPIMYQLNSYFEFYTTLSAPSTLEMRISAQNLIVDDVDDLRIVSNGQAAPGSHIAGLDPDLLWARRNISFAEIDGQTFTVGSFRLLSILPVTWISEKATWENDRIRIEWSTSHENQNKKFIIYRSFGQVNNLEAIAEIPSKGESERLQVYSFIYSESIPTPQVYFQLEQVDLDGKKTLSRIFRLEGWELPRDHSIKLWPNPYREGPVYLRLGSDWNAEQINFEIRGINGQQFYSGSYDASQLEKITSRLPEGFYLVTIREGQNAKSLKWIISR